MENKNLKALYIIVYAGFANDIIDMAREAGSTGATILNARGGEGIKHETFMGITLDSEKEMVLSIVDEDTANKIMAIVKERAGIKTPAHGICFTMNIDKMIGLQAESFGSKSLKS